MMPLYGGESKGSADRVRVEAGGDPGWPVRPAQVSCPECGGRGRRRALSGDGTESCVLCFGGGWTSPIFTPCRHPHAQQRWERAGAAWGDGWTTACRCQQQPTATGRRLPLPVTTARRTRTGRPAAASPAAGPHLVVTAVADA